MVLWTFKHVSFFLAIFINLCKRLLFFLNGLLKYLVIFIILCTEVDFSNI